ncbi:MAG: TfoX/Sxy family protein [Prolixibacteraceae bacterium]|nr:TfoX/Sxy family protein [Prolixibacteraceae bacterium]
MVYSKNIASRIRKSLEYLSNVEEKKMFGSLAFLLNGKICLTAGPKRLMCRINPELHEQEIQNDGCSTVIMRGREYKGYLYIKEESLKNEKYFQHWISLALDFNKQLTEKQLHA